jgi:hypothetical protein
LILLQCSNSYIEDGDSGECEIKLMSGVWKTKYGPRRVRHDPPTLDEAVAAARGLTDDLQQQIEIAASLMDLPADQVRREVLKAAASRKEVSTVAFVGRPSAPRTVVVERVPSRRQVLGKTPIANASAGKSVRSGLLGTKSLSGSKLGR